jgi:hypothetical protein
VAVLRLHEGDPVPVDCDLRGRHCEGDERCATGGVFALSLAGSRPASAVAVYNLANLAEPERVVRAQQEKVLDLQPVTGELDVLAIDVDADDADERGRGEPPWDRLAELPPDTAIELGPRLAGIREFRMRGDALRRLMLGEPEQYVPIDDLDAIAAAARAARGPRRRRRRPRWSGRGRRPSR